MWLLLFDLFNGRFFAGESRRTVSEQLVEERIEEFLKPIYLSIPLGRLLEGPISNEVIRNVEEQLQHLDALRYRRGNSRWSLRPRTYIVLRLLGCLDLLDSFVTNNTFDSRIPYDAHTLPGFVEDSKLRRSFIKYQVLVLTDAKRIEDSTEHVFIQGNVDIFRRNRQLGRGDFG
jgi:hypothetical protein